MSCPRTLAVFDLDGTLVDAFGDIRASLNHALSLHGLPGHSLEAVKGWVGDGLGVLCERALGPDNRHLHAGVLAAAREYYAAHPVDRAFMYPGARELLADLPRLGVAAIVLSNKPEPLVRAIADGLGFRRLVLEAAGARPDYPLKPDPARLDALRAGRPAEELVIVGDGLPDAELARRAGGRFVGVSWGVQPAASLAPHGPVAGSMLELARLIVGA